MRGGLRQAVSHCARENVGNSNVTQLLQCLLNWIVYNNLPLLIQRLGCCTVTPKTYSYRAGASYFIRTPAANVVMSILMSFSLFSFLFFCIFFFYTSTIFFPWDEKTGSPPGSKSVFCLTQRIVDKHTQKAGEKEKTPKHSLGKVRWWINKERVGEV